MDRAWHRRYDPGVPTTLQPYPERTLLHYQDEAAAERPNAPAILFKGRTLSYAEIQRQSEALAAGLASLGVRRGDRVALLLPNCPQFIVAQLAAWRLGAVVAPLNPIYTESELATPLAEVGAEVIVTLSRYYERVKRVQPRTAVRRVVATNIKEHFPLPLRLLFTLAVEPREGDRISLRDDDVAYRDLLADGARAPWRGAPPAPGDPAVILLSGGTTGTPKGVVGLHRNAVIAGLQTREWMRPLLADERDTVLLPLPLFHTYANTGVYPLSLIARLPLCLVPNPRDVGDVVRTIERVRPAFVVGVPTLFSALLNHPRVRSGKADFRSIKLCFSGAAALMAETKRRFEEVTGGRILEGYSMTEAQMACTVNPVLGERKLGSVGLPLTDVEVEIVDAETGTRVLPAGEVGEIVLHAPQIMRGYWANPDESALMLRERGDGRTWLYSGDLGYLDEDGYLFIVDRKKDLIKMSGYQVWPREVEEAIATHPAVAEVGVAGVPDANKGEAVRAWVVLRPGMRATADELREHCRALLAPYKVPSAVEFRAELPKSLVGKVLRRKLATT